MPAYGASAGPRAAPWPDGGQRWLAVHPAPGCSEGKEVIFTTGPATAELGHSMTGHDGKRKEEMTNA